MGSRFEKTKMLNLSASAKTSSTKRPNRNETFPKRRPDISDFTSDFSMNSEQQQDNFSESIWCKSKDERRFSGQKSKNLKKRVSSVKNEFESLKPALSLEAVDLYESILSNCSIYSPFTEYDLQRKIESLQKKDLNSKDKHEGKYKNSDAWRSSN